MRIPAIYRDSRSSDPLEHLVWIVAFMGYNRWPSTAICVDGNGRITEVGLDQLEVVGWPDDEEALKVHRPPRYDVPDEKIRSITDRPART